MGVTSRSTSGRTSTHSNSPIPKKKQGEFDIPGPCGRDGANLTLQECGSKVVGCVYETIRHRRSTENDGKWDEYEMKHCLEPQRPRPPRALLQAMQASGQDPKDLARDDSVQVSGCMKYVTVENDNGNADNEIDICFCDGDECNKNACKCTQGDANSGSGGSSFAAFSALTAVAAVAAKHLA